jgi:hypothetical protein
VVSSAVSPFRDAVSSFSSVDPHRGHDTVAAELIPALRKTDQQRQCQRLQLRATRGPAGRAAQILRLRQGWVDGHAGAEPVPAAYRGTPQAALRGDSMGDRQPGRSAQRSSGSCCQSKIGRPQQLRDQLSPDFPGLSSASCPALATSQWRRSRDVRPHTWLSRMERWPSIVCSRRPPRGQGIERAYEGYVAKDEGSAYEGEATKRWLKVKVPGWTDSENSWRRGIRSVC